MKRWSVRVCVAVCAFASIVVFPASRVGAAEPYPQWQSATPSVRVSADLATRAEADRSTSVCTDQAVTVFEYGSGQACVVQMKGWRYALYTHRYWLYGLHTSESFFSVSLGTDTHFYRVEGLPGSTAPLGNAGSDTLAYSFDGVHVLVYRHFPSYLTRDGPLYRLSRAGSVVTDRNGDHIRPITASASRGGDWAVVQASDAVVRIDLSTLETRRISPLLTPSYASGNDRMDLAISDDGQTVFVGGRMYAQRQFRVITVKDGCGSGASQSDCATRDLTYLFASGVLAEGWPVNLRLSTHGSRLDLFVERFDSGYVRASVYPGTVPDSLRYLALGDSFSSGEGAPGTYLNHTDAAAANGLPAERCHISNRSYPFRLAEFGGLDAKSVACNNARITDVSSDEAYSYQGQDGRLGGLSAAVLGDARSSALSGFIPGRIRQADFVEEYQPRAITVGIGGNDVQFARVLSACARSVLTCDYAADPTDRRNLGESIKALYPKLTATYANLARLDPSARIYAVGYPRFVNETNDLCPITTNLDYAERAMIDAGVRYLNSIVKSAAASAGIGYLDVEDALSGHRVCDDPGGYVNAINFTDILAQETFHPNALGHQAMALTIERRLGTGDLAQTQYCQSNVYPCPRSTEPPGLPKFFGDESLRPKYIALPSELVVSNPAIPYLVTKGVAFTIKAGLLASGSLVRMELHSQVVDLGTATVSDDGVFETTLTLADPVETGFHTLHVYGVSPSGEAVDRYQIIYIASATEPSLGQAAESPSGNDSSAIKDDKMPLTKTPSLMNMFTVLPDTAGRFWPLTLAAASLAVSLAAALVARKLWRRGKH